VEYQSWNTNLQVSRLPCSQGLFSLVGVELNMSTLKISVVIPVRNRARELATCLGSLQKQSLTHECIVVDQGSTDGTLEVARSFDVTVVSVEAATVGALRNHGVRLAKGEMIAFMDSDHEVTADWLETGWNALMFSEDRGIVGSRYLGPSPGTWVTRAWAIHRLRNSSPSEVTWLSSGNMFIRKKDLDELGGFREELIATEDVDLCYRMRALGKIIFCDPSIRSIHHGEPSTVKEFFQKQVWRGNGGWNSWVHQGFPMRELRSLLYPLWVGGGFCLLLAMLGIMIYSPSHFLYVAGMTGLLVVWLMPPMGMAMLRAVESRRLDAFVPLFVLYMVYGVARFVAPLGWSVTSDPPQRSEFGASL
jgi:glycosyltransferase involved in cell wall biosynthesis